MRMWALHFSDLSSGRTFFLWVAKQSEETYNSSCMLESATKRRLTGVKNWSSYYWCRALVNFSRVEFVWRILWLLLLKSHWLQDWLCLKCNYTKLLPGLVFDQANSRRMNHLSFAHGTRIQPFHTQHIKYPLLHHIICNTRSFNDKIADRMTLNH